MTNETALLVLETGKIFTGVYIGAAKVSVGEIVFNTANVGYQEAITDPSYAGQLLLFTTPHIGNVGCNSEDEEAAQIAARGIIVREIPITTQYWRKSESLENYLTRNNLAGIAEVDTRELTRFIRDKGHSRAVIVPANYDVNKAIQLAKDFHIPIMNNKISLPKNRKVNQKPHIVVYDFGVKKSILTHLSLYADAVTVVPPTTSFKKISELAANGIVLSNGPGDPNDYIEELDLVKKFIATDIPILGICLGHQLLGLALSAQIEKLKFGHHGINHPIQDLISREVFISSQNHNFVISKNNLPENIIITHQSLFDGTIQGIRHRYKAILGIQGHPEGAPGPAELSIVFSQFFNTVNQQKKIKLDCHARKKRALATT